MILEKIIQFWKPALEIIILWFIVYRIMLFFSRTRAILVLRGLFLILFVFLIFQKFNFVVLEWLFTKFFAISVLAFLIIFQPEIRQGLAHLGRHQPFDTLNKDIEDFDLVLKEVLNAAEYLCANRIGALIVFVKDDPINEYVKSGVWIDGKVSSELIQNIFTPNSLLHDGGVVISGSRILAAGCIFPLSEKEELNRSLGTRHRAALGLSEETDAVILVISEERQDMSLAYREQLYQGLNREEIFSRVKQIFKKDKSKWLKHG